LKEISMTATADTSSTTHAGTAEELRAITGELADRFLERAGVVRSLVTAVLAGQHSLLLGPPGTAKSELARELTSRIDGARYWEILLSSPTPSACSARSMWPR
jgi:MoxR-like ATPase